MFSWVSIQKMSLEKKWAEWASSKKFDPVEVSHRNGVRYLKLGSPWIQGAMRLNQPQKIELEYVRTMMIWMVLNDKPSAIAILGLGAGSLAKICHQRFEHAAIEVVELNPWVIKACKEWFALPQESSRFVLNQEDAGLWVLRGDHAQSRDIILVDVYDAKAEGPVLESESFYKGVSRCLKPQGLAIVNLFGDHPSYERNITVMKEAFQYVRELSACESGNIIVVCSNHEWGESGNRWEHRAELIEAYEDMETTQWVKDLRRLSCNAEADVSLAQAIKSSTPEIR